MREIVLDTETTGFDPAEGDRLVEIGCLELDNLVPTGNTYHVYVNPERDMPEGAFGVHGLSEEFLSHHPVFEKHADAFLEFIGDSPLVIHNASFDMKFLNAELAKSGRPMLPMSQAVDTLMIARKKFPGQQNSLDALCRRFNIDNGHRTLHGALLDSELLAEVYMELKGGRQTGFDLSLARETAAKAGAGVQGSATAQTKTRETRSYTPSEEELEAHKEFLNKIKEPIWLK